MITNNLMSVYLWVCASTSSHLYPDMCKGIHEKCMHACTHIHMHIHANLYAHAYPHSCKSICTHTCRYAPMYLPTHGIFTCIHKDECMHTYINVYIQIHGQQT